jgi:carnitine-CoA ligase
MLRPIEVLALYPPHRQTLTSMLGSRAQAGPERQFVVFQDEALSYRAVERQAEQAATMYAARGVGPGDRIAVMSLNHPSTITTFYALARLGAIMVPVNAEYRTEETAYVLSHAQVAGVLCSPTTLETARAAASRMDRPPWLMLNEGAGGDTPVFGAEMAAVSGVVPPAVGTPASTCVLVYTSGTTGFPKGVMHSQRTVVLAGEGFVERMYLQPSERLLCVLPLFHINALFYSLTGALAAGATIILEPRFSASAFWKRVVESCATEVNALAAAVNILVRRPRSEFVPGHPLRKIYGGPFSEDVYRALHDEFGVPHLVEGYGMSEIPGVLNNPFLGEKKVGSMGQPSRHPDHRFRFAQVEVVDESGRARPDGQSGELVVRTPLAMQGYYRAPEQTAAAFRDGWFLTGDLGYRDADGYFWFISRRSDLIRRRGENIAGAEIDRIMGGHDDVLDAAAIAVPAELGEDEILVAVVRKPGATVTAEELAAWCRERLAPFKVPRYMAFVDSLPKTATQRVEKYKLRADTTLRARAVDLGAAVG